MMKPLFNKPQNLLLTFRYDRDYETWLYSNLSYKNKEIINVII